MGGFLKLDPPQIIQTSAHFSIETYGFWGIPHFKKPPYVFQRFGRTATEVQWIFVKKSHTH